MPRVSADIVCVSFDDPEYNNSKGVHGETFVIDSPGEYEVKGIFINSIRTSTGNMLIGVEMEDMFIANLGHLASTTLSEKELELVEGSDIVILPIGGNGALNGKDAGDIIQQIEPRIVIPVRFKVPKLKKSLEVPDAFLKSQGVKNGQPEASFKISKKDLPQDQTKIVILAPKQ